MTRPKSATDRAYHDTRGRILDGVLAGGDVITEGQVSTALGISRTPVREAFLRLQAEGLLQLYPKRGAVVVPVSAEEVDSVMEAREIIETFAAEKLLSENEHLPAALLDNMWLHLSHMQTGLQSGTAAEFYDAETGFHLGLVAACSNPYLVDLFSNLRDHQRRLVVAAGGRTGSPRREASYRAHVDMSGHLERGSLDRYLSALRAHLRTERTALHAHV
ncbi:GntR family transcriptional regulator [Agilicoccus flavus]|uniref:GntR family transcriptional regulator n=1 Tax=Agilicoccus flavus TaxID=2775968 RepID=UPI001CF6E18C|nr:GntR family transcriptional regulator [Agilicoccus flavus]